MSHGVHAVQHEVEHHIEHEEHGHGGGRKKSLVESLNKKIALLISVLALFLAISEMLGKSSQTEGISLNILPLKRSPSRPAQLPRKQGKRHCSSRRTTG